ncbi:SET domain-containing protein [Salinimicrobium sp. GXAS 041]|uniref:SET domain-containing protein n=1 Tax=Salinimicrobium sp. GXAS 041 TaxID=3400806 RepID=UPI003C72CE28
MMHPNTKIDFISDEIGYGVVAKKFIPKGTITWVQDELDQVFSPQQYEKMKPASREMMDKYSFRNNAGNFILCWDLAKYVNHSFQANCLSTAYDFEVAIRDIFPGEQLTDDYGFLNVTEPFVPKDEGTERKVVFPDDLLNFHKVWDEKLEEAFFELKSVGQPLLPLVSENIQNKIEHILKGKQKMDSILNLFYHGSQKITQ